ncbi:hypothetical protein [Corallococcus exercitus]|uniref:hypothetical protein n=1 Tax=Corallococcus exercitus TaxID=2316736 RepID=UPI0035D4A9AC
MKRDIRSWWRGAVLVGVLAGAGVAVAELPPEPLPPRTSRFLADLLISEDDVTGSSVQLSRLPGELRGRVYGSFVSLRLEDARVKGNIGQSLVNLDVKKEDGVLKAQGGFWGRPVTLSWSPRELTVYVRDCTYRLHALLPGRIYEGPRSCDSRLQPPMTLTLPDLFLSASPEEQASLLLLTL